MKVYMTKRNADMTEGRGPMVNDLCFLHRKDANDYIDTKYGDWEVKEIEVLEYNVAEAMKEKKRIKKAALAKLTNKELEILGLSKEEIDT